MKYAERSVKSTYNKKFNLAELDIPEFQKCSTCHISHDINLEILQYFCSFLSSFDIHCFEKRLKLSWTAILKILPRQW